MKNTIIKDALAITIITLIAGLALGTVQEITKEPIARQEQAAKEEAYRLVFEDADTFEVVREGTDEQLRAYLDQNGYEAQSVDELMLAKSSDGVVLGYALTVTSSEGYGGDIRFTMGVQSDGTLNGISILSISETAGLGMRATTEEFQKQFRNKKEEAFTYTKSGAEEPSQIDAISGATITTNAMVNGVNAGLLACRYEKGGGV